MKEDIKKKWVAALRDPNARQAKGALSTEQGDCCLGVLCKIAVDEGVIESPQFIEGQAFYEGEHLILPESVRDWAGLSYSNPEVVSPVTYQEREGFGSTIEVGTLTGLASLNDNVLDFIGIAHVIEDSDL